MHLNIWSAASVKVPKAFSLLPVQGLQSHLVEFEGTALCSFFTDWLPGEMERLTEADGTLEAGGTRKWTSVWPLRWSPSRRA